MSLRYAYAFGNLQTSDAAHFSAQGIHQFSLAPTLPGRLQDGFIGRRVSGDGASLVTLRFPRVFLKANTEASALVIGFRLKNFQVDSNTQLYQLQFPGFGVSAGPAGTSHGLVNGKLYKEIFVELVIDRTVVKPIDVYIDGVLAGTHNLMSANFLSAMNTSGYFDFYLPIREYSPLAVTMEQAFQVRDVYVQEIDDVYPNVRLGPVSVKNVPLKVVAASGFDKSPAELETILNQFLAATGSNPFQKNSGVATTNDSSAEIEFEPDLTGIDVSRQIALGFRTGATRRGVKQVTSVVEIDDGTTQSSRTVVTTPDSDTDRMAFSTPYAAKSIGDESVDLNNMTYKLKINGV